MKEFEIKTYKCDCGYKQDFEPTADNMTKYFNQDNAKCPSCGLHDLTLETDKAKMMKIKVMIDSEIGDYVQSNELVIDKNSKIQKIKDNISKLEKLKY